MTATLEAMEMTIRLERALASGRAVGETAEAAQQELTAARAEIQPMVSDAMDWAFQTIATYRADRRRLEGTLAKARRSLKKAEEDGIAAAAAAAKKYTGMRAKEEASKVSPQVTAAKKEIADTEQMLADLEKNNRFLERLVAEECDFVDGLASVREWQSRGSEGEPPACATAWMKAARQTADALFPMTPLGRWKSDNEERMYTDVADSPDEDMLLWSLPEPETTPEPEPSEKPKTVTRKPKKPVIPVDETPAQRKRRMLFRKIGVAAAQ